MSRRRLRLSLVGVVESCSGRGNESRFKSKACKIVLEHGTSHGMELESWVRLAMQVID